MEETLIKKNNKHTLVAILLVVGLISLTLGFTVAFFNYTRTGSTNVLAVGRIYFNSSQGTSINLTNVFPVKSTELENNPNVSSVTLTITGDTTYNEGLEYLVSTDQVVNTVSGKQIPIGTSVTVNNLGTSDDSYFENRGDNSSLYKVLSKGNIKEDGELVVGYITKGATGVNGTVTVSAWLDGDKIAITDTYDGTESDNNGTTNEWVGDRTVLTTTEWNSLQSSGISFKLKVEANEGIWVEEQLSINVMNTFFGNIMSQSENISEIYFNKMNADLMQTRYDAADIKTDITYNNEGKVLAWLEPDIQDNSKYIMYIASDGKTYLTTGGGLFTAFSNNLEKVEFNNVDTSRVTTMGGMFYNCTHLTSINMLGMGSDNLSSVQSMFSGCGGASVDPHFDVNMSNFNFGLITNLSGENSPFYGSHYLSNVDLSNSNMSNVLNLSGFLASHGILQNVNMSNINMPNAISFYEMFNGCGRLQTVNMSGISTNNVNNTEKMFNSCSNLSTVYVSSSWNIQNVTISSNMFGGCTSLVGGNGTVFDSTIIDKTRAIIDAGVNSPGYLTLKID